MCVRVCVCACHWLRVMCLVTEAQVDRDAKATVFHATQQKIQRIQRNLCLKQGYKKITLRARQKGQNSTVSAYDLLCSLD